MFDKFLMHAYWNLYLPVADEQNNEKKTKGKSVIEWGH